MSTFLLKRAIKLILPALEVYVKSTANPYDDEAVKVLKALMRAL